ncbi:MAG: preprotein translocase subunit SecG [Legionellaceae bacterium]|nr:preprotein translocase subunit SecG [Legionellaceae bacterium]
MYQVFLVFHVLIAMTLIGLVLMQHGKGADIGAAFGSGASGTVFGSQGVGSFLFKLTGGLALAFFVTSVSLSAMMAKQYHRTNQVMMPQQSQVPSSDIPIPKDAEQQ